MASNLQQLAESLARRLGRSVAIDDTRVQLLAYSPHQRDVDAVRAGSILRRAVPKAVVDHVYSCAGGDSEGLFTVTARQDLGLHDPRIGHHIVYQETRLGFLWLLSSDGPVGEDQHEAIARASSDAALLMHREYLQGGLDRERERRLLGELLGEVESQRASAADDMVVEQLFTADSFAAVVVTLARSGQQRTDADQLALSSGLEAARSKRQSRHVITLEHRDHAVLIVAVPTGPSAREELVELGTTLREAVMAKSDAEHCWVGIGRTYRDLLDARRSYDEARRTAQVCRQVQVFEEVTLVETLGVYELLGQVPHEALDTMLHPGLRSLLAQQGQAEPLVQTLEAFLDNAGDVRSASEQLFVHRTSLYYRLRRIQEVTGLDLSSGDDRLIAHLGLKIARLTGRI
ncbi:helix-turn-helix domain-containing protein [Ornithinimicrobium faecis]|uniref:Helix-turn-helix domain-containing protein n=1 Tax=Ornithinimicrobium faecis TaxID=2934158 RepID=A0ABY4YXL5_9MICO|nr:helix-turn-helix domain-containing protein [Ornithinimicrobium sp. HY1793]USQ81274.1 helix-turn-helix domain-containing protein [Ornithinimicrobium sp. HY1793]